MSINYTTLITQLSMLIIPMIFAVTVHEAAHAYVAKIRGDSTAYLMGRVTLNPIKHIDPIGAIILPAALMLLGTGFLFGWAKPVPVNFNKLKQPKLDTILVAIAGPLSNLVMAIIWFLLWKYVPNFGFHQMARFGITINLILMVFNLLPIPPLDGSKVVSSLLPIKAAMQYNRLERWGFVIILLLFIPYGQSNIVSSIVLPIIQKLAYLMYVIF